jgi:hypothetical protein
VLLLVRLENTSDSARKIVVQGEQTVAFAFSDSAKKDGGKVIEH